MDARKDVSMSYLQKVDRCNRRDLSRYVPFTVNGVQMGWVTAKRAKVLRKFKAVFSVTTKGVALHKSLRSAKARSKAFAKAAPQLVKTGAFPKLRGELYAVRNHIADKECFQMDRGLTAAFGVRAYGVHVNGYVRKRDGLYLWIGTRGSQRMIEPGKLDSMVGGGQPAGLTLMENLLKECGEEAHLRKPLARKSKAVSTITYCCDRDGGLRVDTLFCYDLEMPRRVIPKPDGDELQSFKLMPLKKVLKLVRDTDRFKFNVSLVVLDFAIRHGVLTADDEPDYERIVAGLHQRPD